MESPTLLSLWLHFVCSNLIDGEDTIDHCAILGPENTSGLKGIRTHNLCDTGAVLYQLSYQANRHFATNDHMVQKSTMLEGKFIIIPARTRTLKQRDLNQSSLTGLCFNVPVRE